MSVLRFIGCDQKDNLLTKIPLVGGAFGIGVNKLQNHFMEIKTGEGKSLILGAMSTLLALMGHEVSCVCYSEYLSKRDYESFKDIFAAFGV